MFLFIFVFTIVAQALMYILGYRNDSVSVAIVGTIFTFTITITGVVMLIRAHENFVKKRNDLQDQLKQCVKDLRGNYDQRPKN